MSDYSIFKGKKAVYRTLGCKLNFAETSTIAGQLTRLGVSTARQGERADLCLVNTCAVTEMAEHKGRQLIRRLVRENEGAFVVVIGCYAQLKGDEISRIEGVDLVLGSNEKAGLVDRIGLAWTEREQTEGMPSLHRHFAVPVKEIDTFVPSCSRGNRTRYFLKVQDGCNYMCTYCTIPFARGFSRNPSISSLVEQARQAAAEGAKEIVLTGVNIGDFGRTTGEEFLSLVEALDGIEAIKRFRISSLEPNLLTDELISYCAQSRAFMPHFHIPLQSGSDEVLKLMHRRYDTALFAHKIALIKQHMPHAFIGVDVMVGTRGERPEFFEQCYDFLKGLPVSQLHVFPYSERPGTAALRIPYEVDEAEKSLRAHRLIQLSDEKKQAFYEAFVGQEMYVLFEHVVRGKVMSGFTENYIKVELPAGDMKAAYDNQLVKVRLKGFNDKKNALVGQVI